MSTSRRVPALDGLRACAILPVLTTHLWSFPRESLLINRFASTGWAGVDLFFVLSGYLITGILWDARETPRYYRNFYARRVLRIFPLYYLLLAVVFLLLPLHGMTPELHAAVNDRWLYVAYLANVALAIHGWGLFSLDITWSLAVEEQFYLVWPVLVRHLTPRRLLAALIAIVLLAPVLRTAALMLGVGWRGTLMLTPFRLDTLAVGALLALLQREWKNIFEHLSRVAPWVVGTGGVVLVTAISSGHFARDSFLVGSLGYSLLAVWFGALLVMVRHPGWISGVLQWRPLRRIGTVSYGIYILHPLAFMAAATAFTRLGLPLTVPGWPRISGLVQLTLYSLAAYATAEVSYRLFETPLLRLKRFFEYRAPAADSKGEQALALEA